MAFVDKRDIIPRLQSVAGVSIELGCGSSKRESTAIGIDVLDYECVDIVGDALEVLASFPEQSVQQVYSSHFLEHVADMDGFVGELERIVKPGGELDLVVPHFSNPYYYSDYTHRSFFGLYSFSYLTCNAFFRRKVPTYNRHNKFELIGVSLGFRSERPFYARYIIKKIMGKLINSSNYLKEFYEENLCYLLPCYEIEYHLRKKV